MSLNTEGRWIPSHLRNVPLSATKKALFTVIPHLLDAITDIGTALRANHIVSRIGAANDFGDEQLNVDIDADIEVGSALTNCQLVVTASSEEDPVERPVQHEIKVEIPFDDDVAAEKFTVAFDPLDGSSIIGSNWTVGSIIGIWKGETVVGQNPRERQVAAILGVYGPRNTAIIAIREPGEEGLCFEVALNYDGANPHAAKTIRPRIKFSDPPFPTRYVAPANLRAAAEDAWYAGLVNRYIAEKYTLRYSGGLVPDIAHALTKGHGVYLSPVADGAKAKLRRLYELCPIALVIECAGGRAIEDGMQGGAKDILDRAIGGCDERGGMICGNREEVDEVVASFASASRR